MDAENVCIQKREGNMEQKNSSKIHTYIGHPRSLCGLSPNKVKYSIVTNSTFFAALPKDQCARCIELLEARGYKIEKMRAQFRALHYHAEQLALA